MSLALVGRAYEIVAHPHCETAANELQTVCSKRQAPATGCCHLLIQAVTCSFAWLSFRCVIPFATIQPVGTKFITHGQTPFVHLLRREAAFRWHRLQVPLFEYNFYQS